MQLSVVGRTWILPLLVRKGAQPVPSSILPTTPFLWPNMLEAATDMSPPMSAAVSCWTLSPLRFGRASSILLLRQERISQALQRDRLREWVEL